MIPGQALRSHMCGGKTKKSGREQPRSAGRPGEGGMAPGVAVSGGHFTHLRTTCLLSQLLVTLQLLFDKLLTGDQGPSEEISEVSTMGKANFA